MFRIRDVIIKSLISIEPHVYNLSARHTKHKNIFFELFGFDILLDHKLKPWLLEVNISPSLSSSSPLDKKIKTVLLCDTLNLAGLHPYDRKAYEKELEQSNKKRLLQGSAVKDNDEKGLVELVMKQPQSVLYQVVQAIGERISDDDLQAVIDFEEEQHRLGNFEKIFPCINNVKYYG